MRRSWNFVAVAFALLAATPAFAHTTGAAGGWGAGFEHPFAGGDHLLAMLLVGVWAAQLGGRARSRVPIAFLVAMAVGAVAGVLVPDVPGVEVGVVGSVAVLGALVAAGRRVPAFLAAAVAGAFALLHGHAHGAEMMAGALPVAYGAGFLTASALLHAAGFAVSRLTRDAFGPVAVRALGTVAALVGVGLLAAA